MRVYVITNDLRLDRSKSIQDFESRFKGWCDPAILTVATTKEMDEVYCEPYKKGMYLLSAFKIRAHNMLHKEYKRLRGLK